MNSDSRDALVNTAWDLIRAYAGRARRACPWLEYDDLLSHAWEGAVRAAERFDPTKGASYRTYAVVWIRSYLQKYIRQQCKNRMTPADPAGLTLIPDRQSTCPVENADTARWLRHLIETRLHGKQKLILLRWLDGETTAEIADDLGGKRHTTQSIANWGRGSLRRQLRGRMERP